MELIILTWRGWNYISSHMWIWHQVNVVVRALATEEDQNLTPKVIYWLPWIKKCSASALGMSRRKNSTDVTRSSALPISWLWSHVCYLYPQVGSPLEGTQWRLAAPHSNRHSYRATSPQNLNRALLGLDWVTRLPLNHSLWTRHSVLWFSSFGSFALLWRQR